MSETSPKGFHPRPWFWALLFAGVILDQGTKYWALEWLRPRFTVEVIRGFWNWTYVENTGVAFGFLQGHNKILGIVVILILGLAYWVARDFDWTLPEVNFLGGMILSGALGNAIDRLMHGFVIDFVDWHYKGWHWPAFNVADSLICVSVVWIILRQILHKSPPKQIPE